MVPTSRIEVPTIPLYHGCQNVPLSIRTTLLTETFDEWGDGRYGGGGSRHRSSGVVAGITDGWW